MALTGIGRSSLQDARDRALQGHRSSLSRAERGLWRDIVNNSKDPKRLDVRQWLEVYAEKYGDFSPMNPRCHLPSGRRNFYYYHYHFDRIKLGYRLAAIAAMGTFLDAWRVECPWIIVAKSLCQFVHCGVCDYLKLQIDLCARGDSVLIQMYTARLGRHFDFQAAQRLVENRVEEKCNQSGGLRWFMHIDKMDQKKSILPSMWAMLSTPLFKLGDRLVAGLIGSMWHGTKHTQVLLRSVFEDMIQGANMQERQTETEGREGQH